VVTALSAAGLQFAYERDVRAVQGVDLELGEGELLVVLGPNGSGKSTLLRLLAGLLAPDAGEVRLDGGPLRALGPRERARRLAVVPQALAALPELRVEDFVLAGRYARIGRWLGAQRADRQAVRAALEAAEVAELRDRAMTELSGGQRQRVLVARALAQEAPRLLVDEPTAALDLHHQLRVFELLSRLAREGRAVLVVTHDANLASQFATRVLLLDGGVVRAAGPPAQVLRREVLEPVYGPHLHFGTLPDGKPFVLPWLGAP
jgi:ABC-type cobalamin/Fe3+-siderophores transport system ATPase subunit